MHQKSNVREKITRNPPVITALHLKLNVQRHGLAVPRTSQIVHVGFDSWPEPDAFHIAYIFSGGQQLVDFLVTVTMLLFCKSNGICN